MLVLGIDSSGKTASVALLEDGKLLSEYSLNAGFTHSQTLLPMIEELFRRSGRAMEELGLISVSAGPGSFTGLRIGAATAKGLALPGKIPVVEVSTLEALMYNVSELPYCIHPIMDARRNQVYTAEYCAGQRRGEEEAISIEELIDRLNAGAGENAETHFFLGDGVAVYRSRLEEALRVPHFFAAEIHLLQRASSVALLGLRSAERGLSHSGETLELCYVRKPQAEREKEAGELKRFNLLSENAEGAGENTPDRLAATNYRIGAGTGYENEGA